MHLPLHLTNKRARTTCATSSIIKSGQKYTETSIVAGRHLWALGHSVSILSYFQVKEGCEDHLASVFNTSVSGQYWKSFNLIRPGGGGGAQRPRWSNSQLPIRNLLSYDAQTWWLLVFILETPFGHILAKLVNQGGCCWSFLIETSQKFWKWKIFPMLENCWKWHGGSILGREERFWT